MEAEAIYAELKYLSSNVPTLDDHPYDNSNTEALSWMGRLSAIVEEQGEEIDARKLDRLYPSLLTMAQAVAYSEILIILYRALARAELQVPVATRGAFITAGKPFDAIMTIGKILAVATSSVMIVDPYLSERVLTDFATMALEGVAIRLLSAKATITPGLEPTGRAWQSQYGARRPLELRLASQITT